VRQVLADVRQVHIADNGDIRSLDTEQAGEIEGDLFIDCTGFKALLIGETLGVPFRECGDVLFCDRALAMQVPYEQDNAPIPSQTLSTAQSAGWIWDIGLPARRGIGHVYSSRHISDEDAERELRAYIGAASAGLSARRIAIRSGHRETFWTRNCVAVGLAAGFLEPLEASAIVLVELSAKIIAEQMPACREVMDLVASRFNATTHYRWGRIIDFLKLHYVLTRREDTAFWRDNLLPETIPERLKELLVLWSYQAPWFHDEFDRVEEVFPAASYQYVLYGMGFRTAVEPAMVAAETRLAERAMRENVAQTERLRAGLPRHRDLIRKIVEHGLQTV
jgi:tryptophan 7-halogenase